MPNSMLPGARSARNDPAMAIAAPAPVHRTAFATIMRAMAPEEAPSAIRKASGVLPHGFHGDRHGWVEGRHNGAQRFRDWMRIERCADHHGGCTPSERHHLSRVDRVVAVAARQVILGVGPFGQTGILHVGGDPHHRVPGLAGPEADALAGSVFAGKKAARQPLAQHHGRAARIAILLRKTAAAQNGHAQRREIAGGH
jgi:hypothetical protein